MNTNAIKRYAPKARTAFIAAMTKQAAKYGLTAKGIEPLEQKGDLALIGERALPASIARPRAALARRVEQQGFSQAMEQAAYSWFNRLCALRYMEIKGYLDHGRRVLSAADGSAGAPQILDECLDIELEGLDKARITELKLDGTKDEELYRELLLTQCHALHQAMPFLFEAVDDALELLLPDSLTKTDSLIRELVEAIPEEDWQNVEIIGWLYQFYISEKKDQVIGKVVKSEDIPAATQLFTPNWIVQYLVQNSLGRQWLQTYPDSPLKDKMPYYVAPGEQPPEVQAQLAAITPESIDPLTIKVLDPACGSGHILVEAYKVLKAIYEERGFRSRDIPQLILEHNLFGLDIDDRAGQLAGFALMMLAREDDRRIFSRELKLNVLALQESRHLDVNTLWKALNLTSDWQRGQSQGLFDNEQSDLSAAQADNRYQLLKTTLARFTQAKTFGSLIEVPAEDAEPLGKLLEQLRQLAKDGDVMQKPAAQELIPFVQQALALAQRYDAVVANPPYMGMAAMNSELKTLISSRYAESKIDIYGAFIIQCQKLAKNMSYYSLITMHSWLFVFRFTELRAKLFSISTLNSLIHLGPRAFPEISGEVVQSAAFIFQNCTKIDSHKYRPKFIRAVDGDGAEKANRLNDKNYEHCTYKQGEFLSLPGKPIIYWAGNATMRAFMRGKFLSEIAEARHGMVTSDNDRFVRLWHEVNQSKIGRNIGSREEAKTSFLKWFPYNKGGSPRKWYGNTESVVNWESDGKEIFDLAAKKYGSPSRKIQSPEFYFKPGITWSSVSMKDIAFRFNGPGYLFDSGGSSLFFRKNNDMWLYLGILNSTSSEHFMKLLSPTININAGDVARIPLPVQISESEKSKIEFLVKSFYMQFKKDYSMREEYPEFKSIPLGSCARDTSLLDGMMDSLSSYKTNLLDLDNCIAKAYGVQEEVQRRSSFDYSPPLEAHNYFQLIISYSIGCMFGRYSLDHEGLVYANAGNQGFVELAAEGVYKTFPAGNDGILPLTDQEWFSDDATNRFREFVCTVWGDEHLQENLDFVAESLSLHALKPKRGESALDTIRRYLSTQFFKDHLRTYKKRPIYWLFSSGKHKAFECLIYLHRYHEGTLARMRTEYVIPLTAKLNTYANKLEQDIDASTSTAEKKRLEKELATLHNQQAELATFDEKLRHYADQRITLDLDDGVRVNYGKFGDLLAEVKTVTGEKAE